MSVSDPRVVNRHRFLPTDGVGPRVAERTGRERRPELPDGWVYVGRGTPLGNPYSVPRDGERDQVLSLYRRWLFDHIRSGDPAVLRQIRSIGPGAPVVCSCAPRTCHADVIVSAWLWLRREGKI